jgi:hypothetical protein
MHVAGTHYQFAILQPGENSPAFRDDPAEAIKVNAVVNNANEPRTESIFVNQLFANLAGIHEYGGGKQLQVAEEFPPPRRVPG